MNIKNLRLGHWLTACRIPIVGGFLLFGGIILMMSYGSFWKESSVDMGVPTYQVQPNAQLIDAQGQPHPALLALFEETGVKLDDFSLDAIVRATQKKWFGGGKERWLMEGVTLTVGIQQKILNLFHQLGLMKTISPQYSDQRDEYDCVLVHGALAERMKMRLDNLEQLSKKGVHFKAIAFLTGERALVKGKEDLWIAKKLTTETQVMQHLWQEKQPTTHLTQPVKVISAPVKEMLNAKGEKIIRRPGTEDTIQAWLNEVRPQPGSQIKFLAISNQPYVPYQHAILERCLRQYCLDHHYDEADFHIETIGEGVTVPEESEARAQFIAICLDNLARCLYEAKLLNDIKPTQHVAPRKTA